MPPRKGNGCSPQFPRDSVAAALAPPPLLKLTPHPLQGGHTLLPFHSIHRLPSKLLAQTMLSQGSSSFHACLPERHKAPAVPACEASEPDQACLLRVEFQQESLESLAHFVLEASCVVPVLESQDTIGPTNDDHIAAGRFLHGCTQRSSV